MTENKVSNKEIKSFGSNDGLVQFSNKDVAINVRGVDIVFRGKLIEITPEFVILRRKDGRMTTLKKSAITVVSEAV